MCVHGLILQHHEGSAVHTKPVLRFLSWLCNTKLRTHSYYVPTCTTCMSSVNEENFLLGQLGPREFSLEIHRRVLPQPYMPGVADPIVCLSVPLPTAMVVSPLHRAEGTAL